MEHFFEKFGFVLYYTVVTSLFLLYYSSKYNINLSRIGKITDRFDIANKGKKFWLVVIIAIILLMSIPSMFFSSRFEYDWVRVTSQVILICIIIYRYTIVAIHFGDVGMYMFDDIIYWENVKSYELVERKNSIQLIMELKDKKNKVIDFPKFIEKSLTEILKKNISK